MCDQQGPFIQDTWCSCSLLTCPQEKRRNDNQNRSLACKIFCSQCVLQKLDDCISLLDLASQEKCKLLHYLSTVKWQKTKDRMELYRIVGTAVNAQYIDLLSPSVGEVLFPGHVSSCCTGAQSSDTAGSAVTGYWGSTHHASCCCPYCVI